MKKGTKISLSIFAILLLGVIYFFGSLGYIPGISKVLGAEKPIDLGITYTEADRGSAQAKSQISLEALPANTPDSMSLQRSGTRPVTSSWNSAEMTAISNDRPWKYWPIKDVQIRINDDGTAEFSGALIKSRLKGTAAGLGAPMEVAETMVRLLPPNPTFYIKGKASIVNNQIGIFDVQSAKLGKMPIPTSTLLSIMKPEIIDSALAQDVTSELAKYSGKKQAIIDFINERISKVTGLDAKSATLENGKLNFDGNLPEKELTVR